VFDDSSSTDDAVACILHPIAQVEYVLEVNKGAVDTRQRKMCQSAEFGDKMASKQPYSERRFGNLQELQDEGRTN
jgi:hypothetical protein